MRYIGCIKQKEGEVGGIEKECRRILDHGCSYYLMSGRRQRQFTSSQYKSHLKRQKKNWISCLLHEQISPQVKLSIKYIVIENFGIWCCDNPVNPGKHKHKNIIFYWIYRAHLGYVTVYDICKSVTNLFS